MNLIAEEKGRKLEEFLLGAREKKSEKMWKLLSFQVSGQSTSGNSLGTSGGQSGSGNSDGQSGTSLCTSGSTSGKSHSPRGTSAMAASYQEYMVLAKGQEEFTALKFLIARNWNVAEAITMFNNYQDFKMTTVKHALSKDFVFNECDKVADLYPCYYHKTDKMGRAIQINQFGSMDVKRLFKITTPERFLLDHIRGIEKLTQYRLTACYYANSATSTTTTSPFSAKSENYTIPPSRQLFNIVDLKGVSLSTFTQVSQIVSEVARIDSNYYPETLGCMVIINAPWIFASIWTVCRQFLDEKTLEKIRILGHDYRRELLGLVEEENLPVSLGGTCTCTTNPFSRSSKRTCGACHNSDIGPWNDGSVPGFPDSYWEHLTAHDHGHSVNGK